MNSLNERRRTDCVLTGLAQQELRKSVVCRHSQSDGSRLGIQGLGNRQGRQRLEGPQASEVPHVGLCVTDCI
jgi:hypothetical protein